MAADVKRLSRWKGIRVPMSLHQKLIVAVMDVVLIVELCVSIYFANLDPENFTPIFMKLFLAMVIPTLVATKIAVKRFRTREPEPTT